MSTSILVLLIWQWLQMPVYLGMQTSPVPADSTVPSSSVPELRPIQNPLRLQVRNYWWTSSSQIFLVEPASGGKDRYERLNVSSGKFTLMKGLQRYWNEFVQPSNNGKKMLVFHGLNSSERIVADEGGQELFRIPHDISYSSSMPIWLQDGSGWVEIESTVESEVLATYKIGDAKSRHTLPPHRSVHMLDGNPRLMATTATNHVILCQREDTSTFKITEYTLDGDVVGSWPVRIPGHPINAEIIEVAVSQDGTQVAWSALTPISEKDLLQPGAYVTYYTSTLTGGNLHAVCRLLMPKFSFVASNVDDSGVDHLPRSMKLSPDGKKFGFLYNWRLWLMDISGPGVNVSGKPNSFNASTVPANTLPTQN